MDNNDILFGLTPTGYKFGSPFKKETFNKKRINKIRNFVRVYLAPTKNVNLKTASAYNIKHYIEKSIYARDYGIGYVGCGELIYAMYLEGYQVKRVNNNAYFNISSKSVKILNESKILTWHEEN